MIYPILLLVTVLLGCIGIQREVIEPGTKLCLPNSEWYLETYKWSDGKSQNPKGFQPVRAFTKGNGMPRGDNFAKFGKVPDNPNEIKVVALEYESMAPKAFERFKGASLSQCEPK